MNETFVPSPNVDPIVPQPNQPSFSQGNPPLSPAFQHVDPATPASSAPLTAPDHNTSLAQHGERVGNTVPANVVPTKTAPLTAPDSNNPPFRLPSTPVKLSDTIIPPAPPPAPDHRTETAGDRLARHESEATQFGHHSRALRLSGYRDPNVTGSISVPRETFLSYARTMQSLVKADTTAQRQAIVDAACDGIDRLLFVPVSPTNPREFGDPRASHGSGVTAGNDVSARHAAQSDNRDQRDLRGDGRIGDGVTPSGSGLGTPAGTRDDAAILQHGLAGNPSSPQNPRTRDGSGSSDNPLDRQFAGQNLTRDEHGLAGNPQDDRPDLDLRQSSERGAPGNPQFTDPHDMPHNVNPSLPATPVPGKPIA